MSSEASDRPSIGSPGGWYPRFDGPNPPIPCHVEPVLEKRPAVALPVMRHREVVRHLPEVSIGVLNEGTKQQSFAICDQSVIDEIRAAPLARIVTVTISVAPPREDRPEVWLVVERATLHGPADKSDWLVLLPEAAGRGSDNASANEWLKAISDWSAEKLLEHVWEQHTERWELPGDPDMASVADRLGSLQNQWHDLMLGRPVQFASETVGLPSPAGAVLSGIASKHALPGDTLIKDLKRSVQITGTVAGFATGNFHMACACLASYTRDRVTEAVSQEVAKLFTPEPEEPARPAQGLGEPPIPVIERQPGTFSFESSPPRTGLLYTVPVRTNRPGTTTSTVRLTHAAVPPHAPTCRQPEILPEM